MRRRSARIMERVAGAQADADVDMHLDDADDVGGGAHRQGDAMDVDVEANGGPGVVQTHASHRRSLVEDVYAPDRSLHSFLCNRSSLGRKPPRNHFSRAICSRLPHLLKETELTNLERYDKIFASQWLDADRVICGTKDNQLVVWNVTTGRHYTLPSYLRYEGVRVNHCGIHSISISSEGMIATGGQEPKDIMLISSQDFRPRGLLRGHNDWVFGIAWVDHRILVSGSRDKQLLVWNVDSLSKGLCLPMQAKGGHKDKVRDLSVDAVRGRFGSLSADATVKVWTVESPTEEATIPLEHKKELVCMTSDPLHGTFAVGSESHVQIADPRMKSLASSFSAVEEKAGVRSLSYNQHILTVGGGSGTISFRDMVADKYMQLENAGGGTSLRTGKGWIKKDEVYREHFWDHDIPNTVYTHCFDPTHTRLFVGGGPLPFGLCGSYAAVW